MSGYDRLAPFIREFIYEKGWASLRDVQEKAVDEILSGDGHVLIAAGTASGKTEAAFFPVLTRLSQSEREGFGALYIGPLKALINDQFERIQDLLDEADIPVFAWHGDRPESEKKRARQARRGVLQITPEALEGLLMRHAGEAARMLAGLEFILIDEVHAFMGTDRGLQLQCQLCRIDRMLGRGARRIGLSATVSDYAAARAWLSAGTDRETVVVEGSSGGRRLDLALQNYIVSESAPKGSLPEGADPEETGAEGVKDESSPAEGAIEETAPDQSVAAEADTGETPSVSPQLTAPLEREPVDALPESEALKAEAKEAADTKAEETLEKIPLPTESDLYADLYRLVRGRRCLVFTNSRSETERVVAALRSEAERRGEPDVFHAHHGSLSAAIRQDAEEAMREGEGAAVAVATRTLELGIDLGSLDRVIQLGPADSCAGFVQRLGRSGRRGQSAVMRFLTREKPRRDKSPFDNLPWELLRTLAVVQLYLEERWVEPFEDKPLPYSLLFQQILSALMPGERTPRALAKAVHTLPAFASVPAEDYMALIRHMLDTDMLEVTETGTLLPGLKGERLAGDYRFLSVFQDGGSCRVVCGDREIGSIDNLPQTGSSFTMAGRVWTVSGVDSARGTVYVTPGSGAAEASWLGSGAQVHDRIVEKMRDILLGGDDYAWLHPAAKQALAGARARAAAYELDHLTTSLGAGKLLLHPWLGTRRLDTLAWLLRGQFSNRLAVQTVKDAGSRTALVVETLLTRRLFLKNLQTCLEKLVPEDLVSIAPATVLDRNDAFVPKELRQRAYVYNHLDVPGLKAALLSHEDLRRVGGDADVEEASHE